jgi:hypothetical protein
MPEPVQLTFHNLPLNDTVEATCIEEAQKLERELGLTGCRVVVGAPPDGSGEPYEIHLELITPGGEVIVDRVPLVRRQKENVLIAVRDAFAMARRRFASRPAAQR